MALSDKAAFRLDMVTQDIQAHNSAHLPKPSRSSGALKWGLSYLGLMPLSYNIFLGSFFSCKHVET